MQLKTILNHVERHKSFVYQEARWADAHTQTEIEIPIVPFEWVSGEAISALHRNLH